MCGSHPRSRATHLREHQRQHARRFPQWHGLQATSGRAWLANLEARNDRGRASIGHDRGRASSALRTRIDNEKTRRKLAVVRLPAGAPLEPLQPDIVAQAIKVYGAGEVAAQWSRSRAGRKIAKNRKPRQCGGFINAFSMATSRRIAVAGTAIFVSFRQGETRLAERRSGG